jgi:hypothetical protein
MVSDEYHRAVKQGCGLSVRLLSRLLFLFPTPCSLAPVLYSLFPVPSFFGSLEDVALKFTRRSGRIQMIASCKDLPTELIEPHSVFF